MKSSSGLILLQVASVPMALVWPGSHGPGAIPQKFSPPKVPGNQHVPAFLEMFKQN